MYHGTVPHCTNLHCKDETGASRDFVLANTLQKICQEITLMDEVDDEVMVIWPVDKILQTILSPHNRACCGLLTGAFKTPNQGDNICLCCSSTTSHAPDCTISLTHTTTSSSLALSSPPFSTSSQPGTSTTTTCPPPAPAHTLEPLQAQIVDDTVKEDMEMDTNELPHNHLTTYTHLGTNGLLTFPPDTSHLEHLPTAIVSPKIREEEAMSSSTTDTSDDLEWLEGIMEQEALEQQLEELQQLLDQTELVEAAQPQVTTEPHNNTPPITTSPIDASGAIFSVTDVRLRQRPATTSSASPLSFSTTESIVTTTTTLAPAPMETIRPALLSTSSRPSTTSHIQEPVASTSGTQGRSRPPRNATPAPRTTTYRVRGSPPPRSRQRRALLPTPRTGTQRRALLPTPRTDSTSAFQLFWWCDANACGRANPIHFTVCRFCSRARVATRRRLWGE